jgi:transcriptional regulator with XRE-family HTH domain
MFTDKDLFTQMGARIRRQRLALDMSQGALAVACSVTKSAVVQWEAGNGAGIKLKTFLQLAAVLGVSLQFLAYGSDQT